MQFRDVIEFAQFLWGTDISPAQITILRCLYGLPLNREEKSIWRKYSGSRTFARYSPREFRQGVLLIGRQAGKSTVLGTTICLFESLVVERRIPAGQRFTALILTPTLRQSTFGKVAEKLRSIPEFADLIEDDAESQGLISLRNGVDIQAVSAVPRFARGFTAYLVLIDEANWIRSDSDFVSNLPELLEAVRPTLITTNGKLFLMSSPGGKEGVLYQSWEERHANEDVFIFKAPSVVLNPAIPAALLEKERKRGENYYRREFLAEFTDSANPFLPEAALSAAIAKGVTQFGHTTDDVFAVAGIDLADKRDDCALCISSVREIKGRRKIVVQLAKLWKPTKDGHVVPKVLEEMAEICKAFGVGQVRGDQKSMSTAEFIFGRHGISFERTVTDGQGSELMYRTFLGLLNNGDILLPDDEELLAQLRRLEERTSDGNRFRVAGRRNSKDDLAVATVLSVSMTAAHMNASAPIVEAIFVARGDADTGDFDEDRFFAPRNRTASFSKRN